MALRNQEALLPGRARHGAESNRPRNVGENSQDGSGLLALVKECSCSRDLARGKEAHLQAVSRGLASRIDVCNSLMSMYANCGSMVDARKVFDYLSAPTTVSWNILVKGYVDNGASEVALEVFQAMEQAQADLDARTYLAAITACASLAAVEVKSGRSTIKWLEKAKVLHSQAAMNFCSNNKFVSSALVNAYGRCGNMSHARAVFDNAQSLGHLNSQAWTALINGYVQIGKNKLALELFDCMEQALDDGCVPEAQTYLAAASACAAAAVEDQNKGKATRNRWLEKGKSVHSLAVASNRCDVFVQSMLVLMYANLCCMVHARAIFDSMPDRNIVTWNSLLQGYVANEDPETALQMFESIDEQTEGIHIVPDVRTYLVALSSLSSLAQKDGQALKSRMKWLEKGKAVHSQAMMYSCWDVFIETGLLDVYASCGAMLHALGVFHAKPQENTVPWNCLIQGYVDNGDNKWALELVAEMDANGVRADPATCVVALSACGNLMALEKGKAFHQEVLSCGFGNNPLVKISLIEFYGKCGCMEAAKQIFDSIPPNSVDVCAWNALLGGYSLQGDAEQVFGLLRRLEDQGVSPNKVTFTHILTACSHAGLTDQGKQQFDAMQSRFGIDPDPIHYSCMVDLLARANHLEEALKMVRSMPCEPTAVIWISVLSACYKWKNVAVGRIAYEALQKMGRHPATYNLMANLYTAGAPGLCEAPEERRGREVK